MKVLCSFEFTDGTATHLEIEKPAGALPDSLATALEAIREAETRSRCRVKNISIRDGETVSREEIMKQAELACPAKVF